MVEERDGAPLTCRKVDCPSTGSCLCVSSGCCRKKAGLGAFLGQKLGSSFTRGVHCVFCMSPTLFVSLICLICLARTGTEFAAFVLKACPFCGLEYILLTLPTYYSDTILYVCFQGFSSALEFISKEMGASSEFLASNLVSESEVAVHS